MAELKDVKSWLRIKGVEHIVLSTYRGWHYTACLTSTPNGVLCSRPRRKCSLCMSNLPHLKKRETGSGVNQITPGEPFQA
jgi:hypothetical protein